MDELDCSILFLVDELNWIYLI